MTMTETEVEMPCYLGIDLHKKFAYWHLADKGGGVLWQGRVLSTDLHTRAGISSLGVRASSIVAAIESVEHYGWYANILDECGVGEIKLANPHKLRLIAENPLKNDKKDAEIIATYLRSGTLPESYLAPVATRDLRELLRTRQFIVRLRARCKTRTRNALAKCGLVCKYKDISCLSALIWLDSAILPQSYSQEIKSLTQVIKDLDVQIDLYDERIRENVKESKESLLLKTVPGIGDIRALTILAEVGDFSRFPNPDKLASFAGLVPRSYSSGGRERLGHITKRGSATLRYAMIQAAQKVNPSWGTLYDMHERIKARRDSASAKVALGRKLLTICWHLIRKGEPFAARPSLELSPGVDV